MLKVFAAATLAAACAASAQAAVIPVGVQNDVDLATVTGAWGWSINYQGTYGQSADLSTLFAGIGQDDWVMLAGMRTGSGILDVLGAARLSDITTFTGLNETHVVNGVGWYFNGFSMGFAGPTDAIIQGSADLAGMSERDRLSWHTSYVPAGHGTPQDYTLDPVSIFNGFRSGSNISGDGNWTRLVLTVDTSFSDAAAIPEPATWALMVLGFAGAGASLRRNRRLAASG